MYPKGRRLLPSMPTPAHKRRRAPARKVRSRRRNGVLTLSGHSESGANTKPACAIALFDNLNQRHPTLRLHRLKEKLTSARANAAKNTRTSFHAPRLYESRPLGPRIAVLSIKHPASSQSAQTCLTMDAMLSLDEKET